MFDMSHFFRQTLASIPQEQVESAVEIIYTVALPAIATMRDCTIKNFTISATHLYGFLPKETQTYLR